MKYLILPLMGALFVFTMNLEAQDKVAYCKHAQTGKVIVIQAGYACPRGYYRI